MAVIGAPPPRKTSAPPPPPARPVAKSDPPKAKAPEAAEPAKTPTAGAAYHVKRGDTLWDISKKAYGDPTRWPEIRDANRGQVTRDGNVNAGATLHLPPKQNVDGFEKKTAPNPYKAETPRAAPDAQPSKLETQLAEEKAVRSELATEFKENMDAAKKGGFWQTMTAAGRAGAETLQNVKKSPEKDAVLQRSDARLATERATEALDHAQTSIDKTKQLEDRLHGAQEQLAQATVHQFTGGKLGFDKLGELGGEVSRLSKEFDASRADCRQAQEDARVAADQALSAQRQANVAARRVGDEAPFPAAKDVGSLNKAETLPADQQKALFGTEVPDHLGKEYAITPEEVQAEKDKVTVAAAQKQINDAANNIQGTDKPYEGSDQEKDARRAATLDAAKTMETVLHNADPALRQQILEGTGGAVDKIARGMTILDGDDTRGAVTSLTRATDDVGPAGAHLISAPLADVIAKGGMEEHGSFLGKDDHRSEQEFVNGVKDTLKSGESNLFARSLTQSLMDRGDNGFAVAVATGGSVPDKNWAESINNTVTGGIDAAKDFAGDIANAAGDWARNKLAETIGVDDRIKSLNSQGDKFTMGLGGSLGAFGVQGGASAQMQVEHTDDGYKVTVSGEASAGVFAKLGLGEKAGGGVSADIAGKMSVEMKYKTQEEAIAAAKTISGIGCATVVAGPAGALLTGLTAGDEIKNIQDHVSKTTVELELSASAAAGFAGDTGIGFGGGGSLKAAAKVGVEFVPGQPPTLVVGEKLTGQGDINVGLPVKVGDMSLSPASLGAKGEVKLETRLPMPNVDVGKLLSDPVGTVNNLAGDIKDTAVTHAEVDVDLRGNLGLKVGDRPSVIGEGGGVNVKLKIDAPTKDIVGALGGVISGDVQGGLARLGDSAQINAEVNTFTTDGFKIDQEIAAGVFKVGVKAEYSTRDETDVFTFKGTPHELLDSSGDMLKLFSMNFAGGGGGGAD